MIFKSQINKDLRQVLLEMRKLCRKPMVYLKHIEESNKTTGDRDIQDKPYKTLGFKGKFTKKEIDGKKVLSTDVKFLILVEKLEVEAKPKDSIEFDNEQYEIISVSKSTLDTVWVIQGRK
jgi:hypothetical protein